MLNLTFEMFLSPQQPISRSASPNLAVTKTLTTAQVTSAPTSTYLEANEVVGVNSDIRRSSSGFDLDQIPQVTNFFSAFLSRSSVIFS